MAFNAKSVTFDCMLEDGKALGSLDLLSPTHQDFQLQLLPGWTSAVLSLPQLTDHDSPQAKQQSVKDINSAGINSGFRLLCAQALILNDSFPDIALPDTQGATPAAPPPDQGTDAAAAATAPATVIAEPPEEGMLTMSNAELDAALARLTAERIRRNRQVFRSARLGEAYAWQAAVTVEEQQAKARRQAAGLGL